MGLVGYDVERHKVIKIDLDGIKVRHFVRPCWIVESGGIDALQVESMGSQSRTHTPVEGSNQTRHP